MAKLGKVSIRPMGDWVIGVTYKILDIVTYNGNLYMALKDNATEPSNDGINWWLILEGVQIATKEIAGKVKPDGKTITIDSDGTLRGDSQVPEGVTYVDLETENQELQAKLPVDADTLEGHAAEYFATKKDLENIETSGGGGVTFPLEVPNSKEIKFIGVEDVDNGNKLVSHILYKNKNDLVLKLIDEKQHSEKELINITENDYGTDEVEINGNLSTYYVRTEGIDLGYIGSEKAITLTPGEAGNRAVLFLQRKNENGYETLLEIDENGISHFFHSIDIKSGNLNLNNSNAQIVNFKNYKITQNGNDDFFVISQNNNIGAFIQFSNSQNQINLHKNINSLHEFFAHELIKCYVNKGIHFAQAGTVYHVYQKGQSGELLFDVVNLLNGSRTNVIDCNLDGTVTFTKKIKVLSDNPDYAALIEVNDCNFMLKGSTGSSFSAFMSVDLDSDEMTVYGNLNIAENNYLYIGPEPISYSVLTLPNTKKIHGINFSNIYMNHRVGAEHLYGIHFANPSTYNKTLPYFSMGQIQTNANDKESQKLVITYTTADLISQKNMLVMDLTVARFGVPVQASNITKMASDIVTAQQEITEQDLQLIETQQMLTDQELENIETQQMLTEIDLEKIEGGQVV